MDAFAERRQVTRANLCEGCIPSNDTSIAVTYSQTVLRRPASVIMYLVLPPGSNTLSPDAIFARTVLDSFSVYRPLS